MMIPPMLFVVCCMTTSFYFITFAQAKTELPSFSLETLNIPRQKGFHPISYNNNNDVRMKTTELFIVSKSHGNPPPGKRTKPSKLKGGGWTKAIDAGDDDKSVEVWVRYVSTETQQIQTLGRFDSNHADGITVVRLVFEGRISFGNVVGERQDTGCVRIENEDGGGGGPFLVIFSSDNRGNSDVADAEVKVGTDNPTFFYVVEDGMFEDISLRRRRGAIVSIQLRTEEDGNNNNNKYLPLVQEVASTNVSPYSDICSNMITSCRYQCEKTCNPSIGECPSNAVCIRPSHYFGYRCDPPSTRSGKCGINAIKCTNLKKDNTPTNNKRTSTNSKNLLCKKKITSCRYNGGLRCNLSAGECPTDAVCIRQSNTYGYRCARVEAADGKCKRTYVKCIE